MPKGVPKNRPQPVAVITPKRARFAKAPDKRYLTSTFRSEDGAFLGYQLTEAGYRKIADLAADGVSLGTIAAMLGCNPSSFIAIRARDPRAQEMLDLGRAALSTELSDILLNHARQGNVVSAIFLAKARAGWVESQGTVEGASQVTNNTQVNIHLTEALTDDQFKTILDNSKQPALPAPAKKVER